MTLSKPSLGFVSLTCLVVANMLGAGVFTTSGFALSDLGSPGRVMLAWFCGGITALCGAVCYGSLCRRLTESGGEYLYLSRVIHPMAGFIAGWVSLLAGFTGATAFAALTFETYLAPALPSDLSSGSIAIGLVLVTTFAHASRLRAGAFSQNAAVILKLGLIAAFIFYALSLGSPASETVAPPVKPFSIFAFAGSLVWISLSYSGFNAAVYVSGEAHSPAVDVPRALIWGTVLVIGLYLALNAVFVMLPPFQDVAGRQDVAAAAAHSIGGAPLENITRALIAMALATSVSSMMMAGPRVYTRMADDGMFPKIFRFHGEVPRASIILQAVITITVILFTDLKELLSYLGLTLSLSSALTISSLFILRRREGKEKVPVWGFPVTPLVFIMATLVLAVMAARNSPNELIGALVTIFSGVAVFMVMNRLNAGSAK
ncbi:MAG: amino acid permease [Acidobacteriota bacterium]|nr:amino acid permease [Acidobacteriota bacterium]